MEIQELYQLYKKTFLVDTDTRNIRPGSLFFALKGDNFNGNEFAEQALEKGARYCVIDEEAHMIDSKTILVNDVLHTLQALATFHRNQLGIPIVSLTGSNGKTTTKELIHAVLKTEFNAEATSGNLNNHIGVPLTLLSFTPNTEIGIVEMGANHQKEIEFLSNISLPDYGYITNFGKAHLEGFGGVEGVIKGKSELYVHLKTHSKTVFVNPEDAKQMELTKGMNRILFEKNIEVHSTNPFIQLEYNGQMISTELMGAYNVPNIIAAMTIGKHFGIRDANIQKALQGYASSNNRSEFITTKNNQILLDAYNANPSSVSLALDNFEKTDHPNKVVILGDMFELGSEAAQEHQAMVDLAESKNFQRSIFVGENYNQTKAIETYKDFESLKFSLETNPIHNAYILIKGSRGMALERLLKIIP
jgi:UDP-N-acetylmuramoyl-tripeptide--D-alanyl-D-alanine ligase